MTYYVDQQGSKYIFKYLKNADGNNIIASDFLGINNSNFQRNSKQTITVQGYKLRRATVEEDVWLEECIKENKKMKLDEALAKFNERFK